ncbi:response regulator [Marivirga atlantica]|uniref:Response regulator n=1 Tax=Marivirga atlantica TaxID=1548457 RepID=A0A937ADH0_9BACT|nr:response regulator [Marivirga atlantica]MBL0764534.1 response regulator [Marivirga atlantica]
MSSEKLNICVIDDDDIYQFAVSRIIESAVETSSVMSFYDGEEALEYFESLNGNDDPIPDIIFLDINMPRLNGFEFMEGYNKIKHRLSKKSKVFMVSSSIDPADIQRSKEMDGIEDYVSKPLDSSLVTQIVSRLAS